MLPEQQVCSRTARTINVEAVNEDRYATFSFARHFHLESRLTGA